ncbi:MAG: hypothetical protein KTR31_08155 [Myxococcales bacterium]|nr:hypothetical protein [Myxococcales bacterium]
MRITWLGLVACITACGGTEESPLSGPGFDELSGDLLGTHDTYLVGLTHLQVKNAPGPGGRFGDHANAVANHLFEEEPEGWLGAGFRNVGRLQQWTMTVWEDEEAMLDFVTSDPHLAAMADITDISAGAVSRSLELESSALPLPWDEALALLLEQQDYTIGDAKWLRE